MNVVFSRFADVLRDGVSLFWLTPIIVALIAVPEMIQHIAEINIGMFESTEAFRSMSDDPRRMTWGVIKVVSLLLAIMAAARFWGARSRGQKWWDLRGVAWKNLFIALLLLIVTAIPSFILPSIAGQQAADIVSLVIAVATLPLLALLVAGLIGDETASLISVFKSGWLATLRILVFAAAVWIPLQWIHGMNHEWAMGQNTALVWALMIFDSLVVGLLAAMAGTALHHGYVLHSDKEPKIG